MKKKYKGIILFTFIGMLLIFWATVSSLPAIVSDDNKNENKNFSDIDPQFCGSNITNSNIYLKEYKIPTNCTQPLAVTTDPYENIWFAQTNTGSITKFNIFKKLFVEYKNVMWELGSRSMIWGIDYGLDDVIWYTDEYNDYLWQFSVIDKTYNKVVFPSSGNSLPQRIKTNSEVIVNDFTGNKLTLISPIPVSSQTVYLNIQSPLEDSVTGGFIIDDDNNIWYTNWIFKKYGKLIKFNYNQLKSEIDGVYDNDINIMNYVELYDLPKELTSPNGITMDDDNNIWLVDTSSSFFFKFDSNINQFTRYVTSDPPLSTYGNASGLIKSPITRPYWNEFVNDKIVFNEQTANSIGVFDIYDESLVEYLIHTKNPNWADCGSVNNCGIAQIFSFAIYKDNIWFTEWAENNIGVIDTSVALPFDVNVERTIVLEKGKTKHTNIELVGKSDTVVSIVTTNTGNSNNLNVNITEEDIRLDLNKSKKIAVSITADKDLDGGYYKILLGGRNDDVTVSKYVTLVIR